MPPTLKQFLKETKCCHCDEPIRIDDHIESYCNGPMAHRECFMRQAIGSVAHQEKRCSCFIPGSDCGDPPGMTRREAAKAAVELFYRTRREI